MTVESLEVSYTDTEAQDLTSDLIIPSGSNIHVTSQFSMVEWPERVSRLSLDGTNLEQNLTREQLAAMLYAAPRARGTT